jgi:WD40 repeat protein
VTGSADKTARLWDLTASDPAAQPLVLRGHAGPVTAMAISPDSRWLATVCGEGTEATGDAIRLWNLRLDGLLPIARLAASRQLKAEQREAMLINATVR